MDDSIQHRGCTVIPIRAEPQLCSDSEEADLGVSVDPTSAVASAPGNSGACASGDAFPALTGDGSSGRTLQLRYRMLDGGFKDSTTRFN